MPKETLHFVRWGNLLDKTYEREAPADHEYKLNPLCHLGFMFYEGIYKKRMKFNLADTEAWQEWQQNMAHFFSKAYVRGYWESVAGSYAKSFQTFVANLVAKT
jgi:hypothetical protein